MDLKSTAGKLAHSIYATVESMGATTGIDYSAFLSAVNSEISAGADPVEFIQGIIDNLDTICPDSGKRKIWQAVLSLAKLSASCLPGVDLAQQTVTDEGLDANKPASLTA